MEIGDAHVFDEIGMIGVVVDDGDDVCRQFSRAPPAEKVEEAVRLFAGENTDARQDIGEAQLSCHRKCLGDWIECRQDVVSTDGHPIQLEFDPLEEDPLDVVGVLFGVNDVAPMGGDEPGDCRNDTALVGTGNQKHTGSRHRVSLPDVAGNDACPIAVRGAIQSASRA